MTDTITRPDVHAARIDPGPTATPWYAGARTAGVLYLTIFVAGLFAELGVRSRLIEHGDPTGTAANILGSPMLFRIGVLADVVMLVADVAIAVVLYRLFRPVSRTLSMLVAAFRMTQTAILGLNLLSMFEALRILDDADYLDTFGTDRVEALALLSLDSHRYGYILGLTFFGMSLITIAYLGARSHRMPRGLLLVLAAAGIGYIADMVMFFMISGYDGGASAIVLAPALISELWFALWLLVKGRKLETPATTAGATADVAPA